MLDVENIHKMYEGAPLLKGVSFSVAQGETVCLLGASGSGKSTLLRIIAGLETPDQGRVRWDGVDITTLPPHRRGFGLMFQDYALFPHRSVAENVAFGLRMQALPAAEIRERVAQALDQVEMEAFSGRRVTDLSGGEQQRVALARAMAPNPRLLMLDEPMGALDRALKEQVSQELRRILHTTDMPAIYVTHDQEEAFAIADRLVLLHLGQIAQQGTPAQIFTQPASPWVARFFALGNLVDGRVASLDPLRVETTLGVFQPASAGACLPGQAMTLLLRPDGATVASPADPTGDNRVSGETLDSVFRGGDYRVTLNAGGQSLFFHLPQAYPPGARLALRLPPETILCLSREGAE